VLLPRIDLEAEVVPAELVQGKDGSATWVVPAFKAGHAEGTAGAGEVGNAVLLGHVESRRSGDVFRHLDRARPRDEIKIFSESGTFEYQVVEVKAVPRTDVSVLEPTEVPSVTLITCTGAWNPVIWDYVERLVVRAELVPSPAQLSL
jgi:LPXTG-site transpeptidase (sortase) family protein